MTASGTMISAASAPKENGDPGAIDAAVISRATR